MPARIEVAGLQVDAILYDFIVNEALPGTGVDPDAFWRGTADLIDELSPRNRSLLAKRDELQSRIDEFHIANPGQPEPEVYHAFLREIGYLADEPAAFQVTVDGVDSEITEQAGPQLVVPLLNARFAINAANARWGSLYDALYGTDVIPAGRCACSGLRIQPRARRGGRRPWPRVPRRELPAPRRQPRRFPLLRDRRGSARGRARRRHAHDDRRTVARRVHGGTQPSHPPCSCGTTGCTSRSRSIARTGSARRIPPASRISFWKRPSPRSWTSRTRWPPSTPRTRPSDIATGSV